MSVLPSAVASSHVGLLRCHTPGAQWPHMASGYWIAQRSVRGIPALRGMGRFWTRHAQHGLRGAPGSRGLGRKMGGCRGAAPERQPCPPQCVTLAGDRSRHLHSHHVHQLLGYEATASNMQEAESGRAAWWLC